MVGKGLEGLLASLDGQKMQFLVPTALRLCQPCFWHLCWALTRLCRCWWNHSCAAVSAVLCPKRTICCEVLVGTTILRIRSLGQCHWRRFHPPGDSFSTLKLEQHCRNASAEEWQFSENLGIVECF